MKINVLSSLFMIVAIISVFIKNYDIALIFAVLNVGASIFESK
jgi:hypothetical protein